MANVVPPTEQKGRRHSSTFTVAVMIEGAKVAEFRESDVEIETLFGHGPGGQHRNKTATAVRGPPANRRFGFHSV